MKNLCLNLLLFILFCSCHEELLQYSCDPVLNELITNHKEEYVQMEINQISAMDINVQRAIFRSFEPAKKRQIWLDKYLYLLRNEKYCSEEYNHIMKLINHLHAKYFEESYIIAEEDLRVQFLSEWKNYAKDNLGWSDKYLFFTLQRLYILPQQIDEELSELKSLTVQTATDPESSCDCSQQSDSCLGSLCQSSDCQQLSGCGLLWQFTCDGNCH